MHRYKVNSSLVNSAPFGSHLDVLQVTGDISLEHTQQTDFSMKDRSHCDRL